MKNIREIIEGHWDIITASFLWLCVWATYDTDIGRFFDAGFPHGALDLIHGVRSLLPFLALVVSIILLIKNWSLSKKIVTTPIGLLGIFTAVGMVSSIFSNHPLMAFYWAVLYGTVIVVLLTCLGNKELLKKIIIINLVIAGMLAVGLTAFFFAHPGTFYSLTFNFFVCVDRPYEELAGIGAAINTFDVAGTRPTGLGRYAGFAAIFALASFFYSKKKIKIIWFLLFILFLAILFFSKGKTELMAFIFAMIFLIWQLKKINTFSVALGLGVVLISILVIFYNIPCTNYTAPLIVNSSVQTSAINATIAPTIEPVKIKPQEVTLKTNIATLSGRTNGVWLDAWHLFLKNPLMGFGFQADRYFLDGQHAHDSVLQALIQAGILGTIPFMLAFIVLLVMLTRLLANKSLEEKERHFLVMISALLVFFAVRSITESVAFFSADWLFVAPMIAYVQVLYSNAKKSV